MTYNSQKETLIIPEYGRNLQSLVLHAVTLESREERQKLSEGLIKLMHQISPQTKSADDAKDRLWNHLLRISSYKLLVDIPEDVKIIEHKKTVAMVKKVPYGTYNSKLRHYGQNIPKLIINAVALEEGQKKQEFIEYIAAFMKLVYRTWNQNHYINDNTIVSDLLTMSDKKLVFNEETMNIDLLTSHINFTAKKRPSKTFNKKKKSKSNNNNHKKKYR